MAGGYVYFVRRVDGTGPVKVGYSTCPVWRLDQLAAWSPEPLELVAVVPGPAVLERRFHALFASTHSHHEWFVVTPLVQSVIDRCIAGTFDVSSLPEPRRIVRSAPSRGEGISIGRRLSRLEQLGFHVPERVRIAAATARRSGLDPNVAEAERNLVRDYVEANWRDAYYSRPKRAA